jgi:hypothetical protein
MNASEVLNKISDVFDSLRVYIDGESELASFQEIACELQAQAKRLAGGEVRVPELRTLKGPKIPSDVHARAILDILSRLPPVDDHIDYGIRLGIGKLLGNLLAGVTHSLYSDFSYLVPRLRN